jgi:hypothetical protein
MKIELLNASNSAQPFPWPLESFSITTKPFVLSSYIVWDIVLPRRRESLHHQKPVRVALDASLTNQSHLFLLNYQRVKISIEILTHPKHPLYHTLSICSHENPNSSQTPTLSHFAFGFPLAPSRELETNPCASRRCCLALPLYLGEEVQTNVLGSTKPRQGKLTPQAIFPNIGSPAKTRTHFLNSPNFHPFVSFKVAFSPSD